MRTDMGEKSIVVLGAGVAGLTTAVKIQEKTGYRVTIIAETFPGDPKTIKYTSHWAGAHLCPSDSRGDQRQQKIDQETFKVMWELSAPGRAAEHCILRIPQEEYYGEAFPEPHWLTWMPDYEYVPANALVPGALSGVKFTTVTIDTVAYLNYLLSRFIANGGFMVRGSVQHIDQIVEGGPRVFSGVSEPVDAIVVCTGIGSRTLGGVEDKAMYPIRGQTVLVRAPWVKSGRTLRVNEDLATYTIPRRSGNVILGGIRGKDDWYPAPRPEEFEDILRRCFNLCPELIPDGKEKTAETLKSLVIEQGCGLRPARVGGVRLEADWIERKNGNGKIPIVFNYGHAGSGFESSWGSASVACELLEETLSSSD